MNCLGIGIKVLCDEGQNEGQQAVIEEPKCEKKGSDRTCGYGVEK